jgi:hypothetical protein
MKMGEQFLTQKRLIKIMNTPRLKLTGAFYEKSTYFFSDCNCYYIRSS